MQFIMEKEKQLKLSKCLLVAYMVLTFIGILMPDGFVIGIRNIDHRLSPFQMIMRWLNYVSFIILPIAVYFDRPTFKKIAIYFCLPVTIIFACLFGEMLPYFTSPEGTGICDIRFFPAFIPNTLRNGVFRGFLFFGTVLVQLATIVFIFLRDIHVWKFAKKDIFPFAIILVLCIFSIMPVYALEGIFDTHTNVIFSFMKPMHILWLLFMIAEVTVFTLIFKKRPMEDRYILVLILSLSLLLQFNQLFSSLGELTCKRMPLQLCNIAAYLIFISIATKNRRMFLFNILVNVAGGIIAALVMDVENNGILNKANIHYIVEHNNVIVVPLLALILGVFEPITMKDYKSFILYFTGYYLIIFVLGTTFNSIYAATDNRWFYCNYLFMFDQETAAELVPFAGSLFNIKLSIGSVTIYPVIQPIIYITFVAIGTGMFFLLKACVKQKAVAEPAVIEPTQTESAETESAPLDSSAEDMLPLES